MKQFYIFLSAFVFLMSNAAAQDLPITFSNASESFIGFEGSGFSFNVDPTDGSNDVGQFFNDGTVATQGCYLNLAVPADLSINQAISLDFYAFDPNPHQILIKLENGAEPDVQVRLDFEVPSPSNWISLNFDFSNAEYSADGSPVSATGFYNRITIFIDEGVNTPGTYLIDNIEDGSLVTDPNELDVIYTDLVWSDEFETDGPVNSENWFHQTQLPNGVSWFNGELQHYTDRIENAFVEDGFLNIMAIRENFTDQGQTKEFTSARLNSKYAFTYGRVDVRARLPLGEGTWPAIWTLGKNINENGGFWDQEFGAVSWPACGEIDIMEHGLGATNDASCAIHAPCEGCFGDTWITAYFPLENVAENFHVYSVNWSPNQITFLIDGEAYYTYEPAVQNAETWPFFEDQYILLNVAMGGIAGQVEPGFQQSPMVIDYVRVYQNTGLSVDASFADHFSVYPNPASDQIQIKSQKIVERVELCNGLGQVVRSETNPGNGVNVEGLDGGLYLLKIFSEGSIAVKKLVVR